jgi:ferredoxin
VIIQLNDSKCQGHQMCAIAAPDLFGSDDYGNAVTLVTGELTAEQEQAARKAASNCPERAIQLVT